MSERMARVMMVWSMVILMMVEEKLWQIMRKSEKEPNFVENVNQKL